MVVSKDNLCIFFYLFILQLSCFINRIMETPGKEKNKKMTQKKLEKDSVAYLRYREKANARKRKFLAKMTEEQKEIKRAKAREYYKKQKAENKVKKISDMTERQKQQLRKNWKIRSKKYRQKKKCLTNAISNTPPQSDDNLAAVPHREHK